MPTRTARTAWDGDLHSGSGQVELTSSGLGTFEVSFPKRASEDGGGATNPEELVGAAHSACYAMSLAVALGRVDAISHSMEVTAHVTVGIGDAGLSLTSIELVVRAEVEGIDEATFLEAAESAKVKCPISRALTGVPITLDAALITA